MDLCRGVEKQNEKSQENARNLFFRGPGRGGDLDALACHGRGTVAGIVAGPVIAGGQSEPSPAMGTATTGTAHGITGGNASTRRQTTAVGSGARGFEYQGAEKYSA